MPRVLSPWESFLRPVDSFNASLLASSRLLLSGTTFAADMHFNMRGVARASAEIGIRADVSVAIVDKGVMGGSHRLIEENIRLHEELRGHERIRVSMGPCTIRLTEPETLARVFEEARRRGRWTLRLLDGAAGMLSERVDRRIYDDWDHAYFLHVEGFHEARLDTERVRMRAKYVEELLEIARRVLGRN